MKDEIPWLRELLAGVKSRVGLTLKPEESEILIKKYRAEGHTLKSLSEEIGHISETILSKAMRGQRDIPMEVAASLYDILDHSSEVEFLRYYAAFHREEERERYAQINREDFPIKDLGDLANTQ